MSFLFEADSIPLCGWTTFAHPFSPQCSRLPFMLEFIRQMVLSPLATHPELVAVAQAGTWVSSAPQPGLRWAALWGRSTRCRPGPRRGASLGAEEGLLEGAASSDLHNQALTSFISP